MLCVGYGVGLVPQPLCANTVRAGARLQQQGISQHFQQPRVASDACLALGRLFCCGMVAIQQRDLGFYAGQAQVQ